jgi:ribonucleoside-diphosphate reductase alpha chain
MDRVKTAAYRQHLASFSDAQRHKAIPISENGLEVLRRRYLRKGIAGEAIETVEEMFWRVAYHVALPERIWEGDYQQVARVFYDLLTDLRFFPNSPTFTGAGTPLGQLAACFVLAIDDDMGKESAEGIFSTLRSAALIQQTGGGNGFSFSRLRPKGDPVNSSAGVASGPVGFLKVYDAAFGEIAQGGSRRGANMGVLRIDHPDIEEFIGAKAEEGQITNFNISVGVTDAFMEAVKTDDDFGLVSPRNGERVRTVRARDLFDKIVGHAHRNGEPGILFLDAANRSNPVPHLYELEATNPCFVGDTRLATNHGFLTMEELYRSGQASEIGTDNRVSSGPDASGCTVRQASPVFKTRANADVLSLTTVQGYQVKATPDHPFLTPERGYVRLADLKPGDQVLIQSGEGPWSQETLLPNVAHVRHKMTVLAQGGDHASGNTVTRSDFLDLYSHLPTHWNQDLGIVLGWLVGDGWLSTSSNSPVGFAFASNGTCPAADIIRPILAPWFGSGHLHDRGTVKQLTYGRLPYEFFASLGILSVSAHEKRVPASVWQAPREAVVGFLQGLFSADGSVQRNVKKKDCTVRLASSSAALLEEVQLLLLNFGIVSRIYKRRDAMERPMPNGKGGHKSYRAQTQYELVIGKANRDRFARIIGFADSKKQAQLEGYIESMSRGAYRETHTDQVRSIEPAGTADVYDLTQPATHSLIASGFVAHNCGEQFLGPYENCCLGSVNLAQHVTADGQVDWTKLRETVELATRFLDDVVSANKYVPAVPELEAAAHRVRRIGLGIMGLADMMYQLGVRYGSEESLDLAGQVMEFIRYHCMDTSTELAQERGPFLAIEGSIYDPNNLQWQPPTPLRPYSHDFGRPDLNWEAIVAGIKRHGIRNGAQTTVAPTGTIGTVTGCEGYGCEPVFALAYTRYVKEKDGDVPLTYISPLFVAALQAEGIEGDWRQAIIDDILLTGTCQNIEDLPASLRHTFVVSQDITPAEHVLMQAALQRFVDNSISKTCNFPSDASPEDVSKVYLAAWELGCKGLTVYVTGSRQEVVLETRATAQTKQSLSGEHSSNGVSSMEETLNAVPNQVEAYTGNGDTEESQPQELRDDTYDAKLPRPRRLHGTTYRRLTPLGTAYVTVNDTEDGEPFEIFMNVGKAGSDVAAVSEALGRLISLVLRMPSSLTPTERLQQVAYQLNGIGGGRHLGFGPQRVRSLPDAIAQVLTDHLSEAPPRPPEPAGEQLALPMPRQIGDLCPDCGNSTLLNVEGCRKCHVCGYSEC